MPSQIKTSGNKRGKSDSRMAIVKWARQNGAVHVKVDGIEVVFPPNFASEPTRAPLSPEDIVRVGSKREELNPNAPDVVLSQHPDEYAVNSDRWANFQPFTPRG